MLDNEMEYSTERDTYEKENYKEYSNLLINFRNDSKLIQIIFSCKTRGKVRSGAQRTP